MVIVLIRHKFHFVCNGTMSTMALLQIFSDVTKKRIHQNLRNKVDRFGKQEYRVMVTIVQSSWSSWHKGSTPYNKGKLGCLPVNLTLSSGVIGWDPSATYLYSIINREFCILVSNLVLWDFSKKNLPFHTPLILGNVWKACKYCYLSV